MPKTVPEMMREAADIHASRAPIYGDNYKHAGEVMRGLFPRGLTLNSEEDWNRIHLITHIVSKLSRYCQNMAMHGTGHADSLDDLAVYAIMARECDEMFAERHPFKKEPVGGMTDLRQQAEGLDRGGR